jgi:hypothetical protein
MRPHAFRNAPSGARLARMAARRAGWAMARGWRFARVEGLLAAFGWWIVCTAFAACLACAIGG